MPTHSLLPVPENEKQLILLENGEVKFCPFQNAYGVQNKFGATQLQKHPCDSHCALFQLTELEIPEVAGAAEETEPQPTTMLVTLHCTANDATYKAELIEPHTQTAKIIK